jgi:4-hydroxy-tetrahydrodipicolinate synthase
MVTPFRNGELDESALAGLVRAQIRGGVDGIVPVGTTGESPTVSFEEHVRVIELTVKLVRRRVKVLAGTGANSTEEAVYLTRAAEKAGADGALLVAPYYNKPTQEGLFQHYLAVARSTKLPVMLYSIPGRCGVEIGVETVRRLQQARRNIVGIKEAGGSVDRVSQLVGACGADFTILSGDDPLTLPFLSVGAAGVISVASNVVPRRVARMVQDFRAGRVAASLRGHRELYPLFKNLFLETNPIPVKAALSMMGMIADELRLPLVPMSAAPRATLEKTLRELKLL